MASTYISLPYTPTTTLPQTATGIAVVPTTNMTIGAISWQQGKFLNISGKIKWSGAGDASVVTVSIAGMAGSPVIDVTALPNGTGGGGSNQNEALIGTGELFSAGVGWFAYDPVFATTQTFVFAGGGAHLSGDTPASGSSMNFLVQIPIVGWV